VQNLQEGVKKKDDKTLKGEEGAKTPGLREQMKRPFLEGGKSLEVRAQTYESKEERHVFISNGQREGP